MSARLVLMTSYSSTKAVSWDYGLRYTRVGEKTNLFDGRGNFV